MNSELENLIKQGVKYADIGFQNCECMLIPIEDIIEFTSLNDEINCVIRLSDRISYDGFGQTNLSPLERIDKNDDITSFELRDKKMSLIKRINFPWYSPDPENPYYNLPYNEYQKSKLSGKDNLILSIKKENLQLGAEKFSLKDILEMNKEMIIIDENNNTYKVDKKDDKAFINNLTLEMLESTYRIA